MGDARLSLSLPPTTFHSMNPLLAELQQVDRAHATARKLLVGPTLNWGRELLTALGREQGGWIGWEPATLRGIAAELAFVPLADADRRVASDVEVAALVPEAVEAAVEGQQLSSRFRALAAGTGFRRAVQDALLQLRVAGVAPEAVRAAAGPGEPAHDVAAVLAAYERRLAEASLADAAAVFAAALAAFDVEAPPVLGDAVVVIAPGLDVRGLPARLLARLLARDAIRLADAPAALPALPAAAMFTAATPSDEVREVLRRALAAGAALDDIEIVATDPDTYGIAFDALAQRLGLAATSLDGVPLVRTRIGRALDRWLRWLEQGLPSDLLRAALHAGDLGAGAGDVSAPRLARALRRLAVGWGAARWRGAVARLLAAGWADELRPFDDEDAEALAARREAHVEAGRALAALVQRLLDAAGEVPERGAEAQPLTSASDLAARTLRWLALVPREGADARTAERLERRLGLVRDAATETMPFAAALGELRQALADLRAWSEASGRSAPWRSRGGAVHLTDLSHAGLSGRRHVFVVGLDAARAAGPHLPDPFVPDRLRVALGGDLLATTADRRADARRRLERALHRVAGANVALSYTAGSDRVGRQAAPAPALLDLFRLQRGQPDLGYDDLHQAMQPLAGAVPAGLALDARDAWLGALEDQGVLLDGTAQVQDGYPLLAAGLAGATQREDDAFGPCHGHVPAAARTDLQVEPVSPSSLEQLSRCPLAWFYRHVLRLRPPEDPEYDPDAWLDPLQRGSLLHAVFERFGRRYVQRQQDLASPEAAADLLAVVEELVGEWRGKVPPPSEAVARREHDGLVRDALAFLQLERHARTQDADGEGGEWEAFELELDPGTCAYVVPGFPGFPLRGRVDRIDRLRSGALRVVDYKTGSARSYGKGAAKNGPFNGGRLLQPALYAEGVRLALGRAVELFEYRFPTHRNGGEDRVPFRAAELAQARRVVAGLVRHLERGEFIPTTAARDCRFCDFKPNCRVTVREFERGPTVESPRADWARARAAELDAYAPMRDRRPNWQKEST